MDGQPKKLSQFDGPEVLKSAHQDENQALRVTNANTSVPPGYSREEITYNVQGSVTNVTFYKGALAEIRKIATIGDVAGSLNNTYFSLYSEYDRARYHVWYNVSGGGTEPVVAGSVAIEVPIETNDSAEMVAIATQIVLRGFPDFVASRINNLLTIENSDRGIATDTTDSGTGFGFVVHQDGTDTLLKSVDIPYDSISKYLYNTQERRFEVIPVSTTTVDVDISAENGDTIAISRHNNPVRLTDETDYLPANLSTSAYTEVWTYTALINFRIRILKVKADTFGGFRIKVGGAIADYYQTSQLERNARFEFIEDLDITTGDIITVEFIPDRIQGLANYNFFFRLEGYEPI